MLLKQFENEKLSQFSYMVGCKQTKEALVIDPERNIQKYLDFAKKEGMKIVGALDTHIHADYISGLQEFANKKIRVYASTEGGSNWQYEWFNKDNTIKLKSGDTVKVGNVELQAAHTPGHTPEHLTYLLIDHARSNKPFAAFTGDFLFVGDVGRPDLLETAAGKIGDMKPSAKKLFKSIKSFKKHANHLLILPGHGSGSACGKSLGDVKYTSLGYEKDNNPALQFENEDEFVSFILKDQPTPPLYFKHMKIRNKEGPGLLKSLKLEQTRARKVLLDTRSKEEYQKNHEKGSIHAPFDKSFHQTAGSYLGMDDQITIIGENPRRIAEELRLIGFENIVGFKKVEKGVSVKQTRALKGFIVDVRDKKEYESGHAKGAVNMNFKVLPKHVNELPKNEEITVYCRSGARSTKAYSYLESKGFKVKNLQNGIKTV